MKYLMIIIFNNNAVHSNDCSYFWFHVAAIWAAPKLCLDWLRSLPTDIFKLICLIVSFIKFKSISPQTNDHILWVFQLDMLLEASLLKHILQNLVLEAMRKGKYSWFLGSLDNYYCCYCLKCLTLWKADYFTILKEFLKIGMLWFWTCFVLVLGVKPILHMLSPPSTTWVNAHPFHSLTWTLLFWAGHYIFVAYNI